MRAAARPFFAWIPAYVRDDNVVESRQTQKRAVVRDSSPQSLCRDFPRIVVVGLLRSDEDRYRKTRKGQN